ncbi:hypothetical protein [Streptomyces sp. TRM64462]|uniref:hypothetical protein n=1 Tax=Streptomyces sp. TRM64462 TaxID=2741726 RepID=UPI001585FFC0|nr:hypothetical protein [Streptomyces sp. TRM64462]
MHTTTAPFTLEAGKERRRGEPVVFHWRGTSPEFGEIEVRYPVPPRAAQSVTTEVRGGHLPTTTLEARGMHVDEAEKPSLNGATLRVDGGVVYAQRNRWGFTKRARSLRLKYLGDRYRLTAVNGRSYTLTREPDSEDPGVVVTVKPSGLGGRRLSVSVRGRALPADIALAALFAGVDRRVLTRGGAVRAGFGRIFHAAADSAMV